MQHHYRLRHIVAGDTLLQALEVLENARQQVQAVESIQRIYRGHQVSHPLLGYLAHSVLAMQGRLRATEKRKTQKQTKVFACTRGARAWHPATPTACCAACAGPDTIPLRRHPRHGAPSQGGACCLDVALLATLDAALLAVVSDRPTCR